MFLLCLATLTMGFWLTVSLLIWRYGTAQPEDGRFFHTMLEKDILMGVYDEETFWISYLHRPYPADWNSRRSHTWKFGAWDWMWGRVEWVPTKPPPAGPPDGYGNFNFNISFHALHMLFLSSLLLAGASIPLIIRGVRSRRGSWRRGFPVLPTGPTEQKHQGAETPQDSTGHGI